MANDTNSCVAKCPQGTGSPADTQKYAQCEQNCFSSLFFPARGPATATGSADGTATGTGAQPTATGADSGSSGTGCMCYSTLLICALLDEWESLTDFIASGTANGSSTGTATGSSASSTKSGAANSLKVGASAGGLVGIVLAAFAL